MKKTLFILVTYILFFPPLVFSGVLTLEEAITMGLKNHESIKALKESEKQVEYQLKKAKSDRLFDISGTYSYTLLKENPVSKMGGSAIEAGDTNNFSWKVNLTQPVFTGFALESSQKIASEKLKNANLDTKTAELDIAYKIKTAYANLFLAEKNLGVSKQTRLSLEAHKNDAQNFYKNGLVPLNDLLKAEVSLSDAEQQVNIAIANLKNAESYLNILMGRKSSEKIEIEPLEKINHKLESFETLNNKALLKRPELKSIDNNINILSYSEKIAKSEYYPKVSFVAGYEQNGDDFIATKNDYSNSHNASLSIQASWTFFDFNKRSSKVKSTFHEKRSLIEKQKEYKKNISLDVETSHRNLLVAKTNIKTAEKSVTQAKENWRITNIQYKEQTTTSTEVLNARTDLTASKTGYFRALYQYWTALADLERSVGVILN